MPPATETQVSLVQIDNYGPWTVTPSPRREVDLQTLQSRLYADLSQLIGNHGGYVFFTRFDNMIGVTNGMGFDDHRRVQESIRNRYPVTVSVAVAAGGTPGEALSRATRDLQSAGSAQDEGRTEILCGEVLTDDERRSGNVEIAHFDVNEATERYTDELNAFEVFRRIDRGYVTLLEYMYDVHEALTFFIGGDNVISVTPGLDAEDYEEAIDHVEDVADIDLKVGVGRGETATPAGMTAKEALERCREDGTRVEIGHGDAVPGE